MGRLSKLLPKPVLRYLQKILNPPKSQNGKYLSYTDTLVILRIPRDGSEPSFRFLNGVIHSMHDSCPSILRCEMHSYIHKHTYVTVQITLRFNNAFDAMNFKVDGLPFQGWLEQREADHLWTCVLYQQDIRLIAGFDRGRSGRTILGLDEPAISNGKSRLTETAGEPAPLVGHENEGLEMQRISATQRGKHKER